MTPPLSLKITGYNRNRNRNRSRNRDRALTVIVTLPLTVILSSTLHPTNPYPNPRLSLTPILGYLKSATADLKQLCVPPQSLYLILAHIAVSSHDLVWVRVKTDTCQYHRIANPYSNANKTKTVCRQTYTPLLHLLRFVLG